MTKAQTGDQEVFDLWQELFGDAGGKQYPDAECLEVYNSGGTRRQAGNDAGNNSAEIKTNKSKQVL